MEFTITKSHIRKTILQYRKLLDQKTYEERNQKLLDFLKDFIEKEDAKVVHTFLPIARNKEVDVTPIFDWLWKSGRQIVVSSTNFQTREMRHFYFERDTILKKNSMDIPEPEGAKEADFNQIDLILVPLLVADKLNNRIGYGGGFYDQLLIETKAIKVGLSLSPTLDEIVQKEEWDVLLDKLAYPKP